MEKRIIELKDNRQIFVDIRESDVKINDPYKVKEFSIKDFVMMHSSTGTFNVKDEITFLGLKKTFNETIQEKLKGLNINRKSFWLKNSELMACLASVIYKLSDDNGKKEFENMVHSFKPDDFKEITDLRCISIQPDMNWFGFMIELNKIKNLFKNHELFKLINDLEEKGFLLYLLAENQFGNEGRISMYLQVSIKNNHAHKPINHRDEFNYYSLTLAKFDFKHKYNHSPEKLYRYFSSQNISLYQLADEMEDDADKFLNQVRNFNKLYKLMSSIKLDEDSYNALVLDLYDRNRNESSLDLDTRLRNLVSKTINNAHRSHDREFNWAILIKNVIINNAEELIKMTKNNPYEITNLFSQKRVIQKMERIYKEVFHRKEPLKELENYIQKQVASYEEIKPFISFKYNK